MSRSTKNWAVGILATLLTALLVGIGTTFASDHDKITRMEEALPRIESKIDDLAADVKTLPHY